MRDLISIFLIINKVGYVLCLLTVKVSSSVWCLFKSLFYACLFLLLNDLKIVYSTYNFVFLIIICHLNFYSLHSNFLKSFHFNLVKIILCLTNMFSLRSLFLPPNQIFF